MLENRFAGLGVGVAYKPLIKSIQSGIYAGAEIVTISPVDVAKTAVEVQFTSMSTDYSYIGLTATLIDSTTLQLSGKIAGYGYWRVVEFEKIKSMQSGVITFPWDTLTSSETISPVEIEKALIFRRGGKLIDSGAYTGDFQSFLQLPNTTTIQAIRGTSNSRRSTAEWTIVEI
jgi:hypothetical protein